MTLTTDELFDVLSSARRRYLLYYLWRRDGTARLQDIAADIAAREEETTAEAVEKEEQNRVYISLYQTHVPKLEDVGLVEYESESQTVRLTDRADEIRTVRLDGSPPTAWFVFNLVLGTLGVLIAAAAVLVDMPTGTALTVTTFVVSAAVAVIGVIQFRVWRVRRRRHSFEELVE